MFFFVEMIPSFLNELCPFGKQEIENPLKMEKWQGTDCSQNKTPKKRGCSPDDAIKSHQRSKTRCSPDDEIKSHQRCICYGERVRMTKPKNALSHLLKFTISMNMPHQSHPELES